MPSHSGLDAFKQGLIFKDRKRLREEISMRDAENKKKRKVYMWNLQRRHLSHISLILYDYVSAISILSWVTRKTSLVSNYQPRWRSCGRLGMGGPRRTTTFANHICSFCDMPQGPKTKALPFSDMKVLNPTGQSKLRDAIKKCGCKLVTTMLLGL